MDLNLQNWRGYRHLQDLIRFRDSGKTLEAGNDWLDKEIHDIMIDLGLKAQKKAILRVRSRKIAGITK